MESNKNEEIERNEILKKLDVFLFNKFLYPVTVKTIIVIFLAICGLLNNFGYGLLLQINEINVNYFIIILLLIMPLKSQFLEYELFFNTLPLTTSKIIELKNIISDLGKDDLEKLINLLIENNNRITKKQVYDIFKEQLDCYYKGEKNKILEKEKQKILNKKVI